MKILLMSDSNCDLPLEIVNKYNIWIAPMTFTIAGKEYVDNFGKSLDPKDFYNSMRNGEPTTTAQITSFTYNELYKKAVSEGYDHIINLVFSSALSGTFSNAYLAGQEVMEEYDGIKISVIDSKSASIGAGIILYDVVNYIADNNPNFDDIINRIESDIQKVNHYVVVDDLVYLKRGGRISSATATIGTLLDIKPILKVDEEGRLVQFGKAKGRKKSLKILVEKLVELIDSPEEQTIGITEGDCKEDAIFVKDLILQKVKVKDVIINSLCPTIGCHAGPGTLALIFFGKNRG